MSGIKIYKCNEEFFNQNCQDSFYWAGFIAADGSVQERKYSKILKISLSNKDIYHLEKFKKSINSNHIIKNYKIKPNNLVKSESLSCEIQITSKIMVDSLKRFNIVPNKTKTYFIPEPIVNSPYISDYMRGYFDGDGCITYCGLANNRAIKQLSFSILGTEKFIEQYNDILAKNCKINQAKITKHYSVYKISYSGNNVVEKIYLFLYKNNNVCLDRKKYIFENNYTVTDAL